MKSWSRFAGEVTRRAAMQRRWRPHSRISPTPDPPPRHRSRSQKNAPSSPQSSRAQNCNESLISALHRKTARVLRASPWPNSGNTLALLNPDSHTLAARGDAKALAITNAGRPATLTSNRSATYRAHIVKRCARSSAIFDIFRGKKNAAARSP